MNWRSVSIGELVDTGAADIQTGPFGTQLKASQYVESGAPVINVRNIGYGGLKADKLEYVSEETAERLASHLLEPDDIVFGRKGAVDRHLHVTEEQDQWLQGSDCIRLRFRSDAVVPRFVSYAFLTDAHKKWMLVQSGNKATMASLNHDIIKRIALRLPAPLVQRKVVAILSAYDDLIENNRRRMALLEEAARQLYREWFVRLRFPGHEHTRIVDGVPEQWERMTLDAASENFDRVRSPLSVFEREARPGSYPYHGAAGILDYIDDYIFDGRYLLVGEDGTVQTRSGAPMLQLVEGKFWVSNHAHVLCGSVISTEFLYLLLSWYPIGGHVTGVAQPKLTQASLNRIPVLVPTPVLRDQFQDLAGPVFSQHFVLQRQNEQLRAARDLLLPRLMSGQLAV